METLNKNTLKNITTWHEMSNEMSNELPLMTSCGYDGLMLVLKSATRIYENMQYFK